MFLLTIWLFLAGYTIAITGKRNLGLSYQPQADGSIKAVDAQGNPARAYSLMDVVQCQDASQSLQGQPSSLGPPARAGAAPPTRSIPNPVPQLNPLPVPNPILQLPRPRPPVPLPNPGGLLGGLLGVEQGLERDVYQALHGIGQDVRGALGGIQLPRIPLPGLRPLP